MLSHLLSLISSIFCLSSHCAVVKFCGGSSQECNIIFLDSPVGTGFSYAGRSQMYQTGDTKSAIDVYTFIRKVNILDTSIRLVENYDSVARIQL